MSKPHAIDRTADGPWALPKAVSQEATPLPAERASHEIAKSAKLFEEAARLRSEGDELSRRVRQLQADANAYRATQRALLNLLEDAVSARDAAKRESAERQRVESELAEELTATRVLQRLSSQLIREEEDNTFYERIVDTAIELVHSDCGSLQLFDPRTQMLRLLAWKGFDPDSAKFWQEIKSEGDASCGTALRAGRRIIVPDVRTCPWLEGSPHLEHYERSGIRATQSTPLMSRGGEPLGVISTHWHVVIEPTERNLRFLDLLARQTADLLERQRNVEALREKERELETVVTRTPFLLTRCTRDLRFVFVSQSYAQMLGRKPEEIVARPIVEVIGEAASKVIEPYFKRALAGEVVEYEADIPFRGAGTRSVHVVYTPERNEQGNVFGWVASIVDFTERKRAELALHESRQWLRLIVENAEDFAIISMDLKRKVTTWNPGAERLLGYTESEVIGQPADIIFVPEDRAANACEWEMQTALATGRAMDERWHVRKNGSRFWGSGVMTKVHDARGEVIGFAKIFRDHTVILEAQQAAEQSRQKLWEALKETERARVEAEAAGRAKDQFLAVLSHELRTPLTPVLMAIDVLSSSKKLDQPMRDALEMMRRNVELEADFIKDLLDVTRIGRGKLEITRTPTDFHDAIRRGIDVSLPEIESREQSLSAAFEAKEHCVEGDFGRLQQVVWNLVKNASKFTPEGGKIDLRTRNTDRCVILEVADTGIGIEAEALSRIFEPFMQANAEIASEFGGLGLGLTIARATIDAHGGELRARSAGLMQGSTFTVILPLCAK